MVTSKDNQYLNLNILDDFGFTVVNEDEIVESNREYSSLNEEIDDLRKRLQSCEKIFLPLLENLAKDADNPMIKWPNRGEVIKKQIENLLELTRP
jgi:predicted  nucleic acid-binding Zn-ribbon protein